MYRIHIENAIFHHKIGLYSEEKLIENKLIINLSIGRQTTLEELPYIDYSTVYQALEKSVSDSNTTLESIIQRFVKNIQLAQIDYDYLNIKISKCNPPIIGNLAAATVQWEYHK